METKAPITSNPGAPEKHEISFNMAGFTFGNSQANDGEMSKLLREGIDTSLAQARIVHGEITKMREGMDANRDEIAKLNRQLDLQNSQLVLQTSKLELQNSKLDHQTKMQNLAFAVQNAETNSFHYYDSNRPANELTSSKDLVCLILLNFRRGFYFQVSSKRGRMDPNAHGGDKILKAEQVFRDNLLSYQIHELTGKEPRFVFKKEEDLYVLCYS
jgi:hypothetical protein